MIRRTRAPVVRARGGLCAPARRPPPPPPTLRSPQERHRGAAAPSGPGDAHVREWGQREIHLTGQALIPAPPMHPEPGEPAYELAIFEPRRRDNKSQAHWQALLALRDKESPPQTGQALLKSVCAQSIPHDTSSVCRALLCSPRFIL